MYFARGRGNLKSENFYLMMKYDIVMYRGETGEMKPLTGFQSGENGRILSRMEEREAGFVRVILSNCLTFKFTRFIK